MIYKRTVGIKTAKIGAYPYGKFRITITQRPNWLGRIFGVDNKVSVYERISDGSLIWEQIRAGRENRVCGDFFDLELDRIYIEATTKNTYDTYGKN